MKNHWRKLLALLPEKTERKYFESYFHKEHQKWEQKGKLPPFSNLLKQEALREFQKRYDIKTLVETGTYLGDTLYALAHDFTDLYSIELSKYYYDLAKKRFRKFNNVHLLHGDSGLVLKELIPSLTSAAIFWLDGHYSGGLTAKGEKECPVFEELSSIFSSPFQHLILIDDARLFVGKNDYPTITDIKAFIKLHKPFYHFSVANDSIRLLPVLVDENH